MSNRGPLFLGPVAHQADGPAVVSRRQPWALWLAGAALFLAAPVFYLDGLGDGHRAPCTMASRPQPQPIEVTLMDSRDQLRAERDRLAARLVAQEKALQEGRGCHMAWIKYQMDLLQVEDQLATSPEARARIQQQIAELDDYRDRILSRHHGRHLRH